VVAAGQLFLLKKMLDKQGQGYQPVAAWLSVISYEALLAEISMIYYY
jgi:hypothetical protein